MKRIIFSILMILGGCVCVNSKTVHTIIFADTNDPSIGNGVKVNVKKITEWSEMIASSLHTEGYQYEAHTYIGSQCNKTNLLNFLNDFDCSGDIVIFFYGGHGGRSVNDTSKFPRMCLGGNIESQFVQLSYVNDVLIQKTPQLQIIIADCCNSYYDGGIPQSRTMPMGNVTRSMNYSPQKIKELFINRSGNIVITGATEGEYGWINSDNGGFFTCSFLDSFNFSLNREEETPSWNTILMDAKDQTFEISQKEYLARRITSTQTPVFDIILQGETPKKNITLTRIDFADGYYLGQVEDNKKQGIGAYYFNNGQRFEGEFVNDVINGSGIYFWSNNRYFAGTWINGKRAGYGIYVDEDGNYYCQYWENEQLIDKPIIRNPRRLNYINGFYIGEISNGLPHGKGKYYWNDGTIFEGTFINGIANGSGLLTFSDNMGHSVGYWKNGMREACYGLECLSNGNRLIGFWENELYRAKSFIIYQQRPNYVSSNIIELKTTPGDLNTILNNYQVDKIEGLVLTGSMDARDFNTIKKRCCNVELIDLKNVNILSYTGLDGTIANTYTTYDAYTIPSGAFFYWSPIDDGMHTIKEVVLPSALVAIERNAFARAYSLEKIVIPEGVRSIGFVSFAMDKNLKTIYLPSTLEVIDEMAFKDCSKLENVYISARIPPTLKADVFDKGYKTLFVPKGCLTLYNGSSWSKYFNIRE